MCQVGVDLREYSLTTVLAACLFPPASQMVGDQEQWSAPHERTRRSYCKGGVLFRGLTGMRVLQAYLFIGHEFLSSHDTLIHMAESKCVLWVSIGGIVFYSRLQPPLRHEVRGLYGAMLTLILNGRLNEMVKAGASSDWLTATA